LEEELAAGGVEDDFAGGGGSEAAGETAVWVGDDSGRGLEEFGWFEGYVRRLRIYGLGAVDDEGDLDGSAGGGENLAQLLEGGLSAAALGMDEDEQERRVTAEGG
jgi:hypothetical protein